MTPGRHFAAPIKQHITVIIAEHDAASLRKLTNGVMHLGGPTPQWWSFRLQSFSFHLYSSYLFNRSEFLNLLICEKLIDHKFQGIPIIGFRKLWLRTWSHVDQVREPLSSRIRDSGTWNHVNQIPYPKIKKRCGDTATILYCHVVLECGISGHAAAFPNDRANKLQFI